MISTFRLGAHRVMEGLYKENAGAKEPCRAWIELDMENLRHNLRILRGHIPACCQLMPAVKADAYGHGAVEIARELNAVGIRAFCVASADEGVRLRRHGIQGDILVLGYTHPNYFEGLIKFNLTQTVVDAGYAQQLNNYGRQINVHLKIDTGMHRLGVRSEKEDEILQIFACKNLRVTGIYTHLCADNAGRLTSCAYTQGQIDRFYAVLARIEAQGFKRPKTHIQSSYGVFDQPDLSCDYARTGIAIYGMLSSSADTESYHTGLRPVLSLKARVSTVKSLYAGETAGYGLAFTAPSDMKMAVLSIGYADGIPRSLSCGVGHVLINGQKAPVAGRVCMDQMLVDISGIDGVKQGDTAVIIGVSGEAEITACDIAEQSGTIANEILSRLGRRLERLVLHRTQGVPLPPQRRLKRALRRGILPLTAAHL